MDNQMDLIKNIVQLSYDLEKEKEEQIISSDLSSLIIEKKPKKKSQREVFYLTKRK